MKFLKKIISVGLLAFSMASHSGAAASKPNIIVFFVDDSGYGDYAHTGNPTIKTPNLTKLATEGVNFTQFYVGTAACSASRYSLLTGRYPGRSGLGSWVVGPDAKQHIHSDEITLPELLKTQGYSTGMFGKWHLGSPNAKNKMSQDTLPLAHGFDQWVGTNVSHDYPVAMLLQSDPSSSDPIPGYKALAKNLPSDVQASESLTGVYTEAAVEYIHSKKDKPFFAYITYNQPHLGLFASDKFKGKSRRGLLGDVMEEIDYSVGEVLKALEESGQSGNTLIIFSSDNGPWVKFLEVEESKYGDTRLQIGYAEPFRDGKGSTWEGGHRVPGIFYWPGRIHPNAMDQRPASTLDIFPTIAKLVGAELPRDRSIDGRDITPYLIGTRMAVRPFEFIYSYDDNKASAIRVGPWKLHTRIGSQTGNNYGFSPSIEKPLLFQIEHDLSERLDVASKHPELVQKMRDLMLKTQAQIDEEGSFWDK